MKLGEKDERHDNSSETSTDSEGLDQIQTAEFLSRAVGSRQGLRQRGEGARRKAKLAHNAHHCFGSQ
jgi:hypothetical protein